MRKVKCQICKKELNSKEAYKVEYSSRNKYYCSKEEFDNEEKRKEANKLLINKVQELFNQEITYSFLVKEFKELQRLYSSSLILNYIEDNFIELDIVLSKNFKNNSTKLKYLIAILNSNLSNYKKTMLENKRAYISSKASSLEFIENIKFKERKRRKSIDEYIEEY